MSRFKNAKVSAGWSDKARTNSLIVLALLGYMGWLSFNGIRDLLAANRWVSTEAVIVHSGIYNGARGSESLDIQFQYHANGLSFVGDKIDFGQWSYDFSYYLTKYPTGQQTTIFYDPIHPNNAVLEKTGSFVSNILGVLLFWGAGGGLFYFRFFKRVKF